MPLDLRPELQRQRRMLRSAGPSFPKGDRMPGCGGIAASACHDLEAESDFEERHGCDPDRSSRLTVKPCDDGRVWLLTHESGEHIGIEDDHLSNEAGLI